MRFLRCTFKTNEKNHDDDDDEPLFDEFIQLAGLDSLKGSSPVQCFIKYITRVWDVS